MSDLNSDEIFSINFLINNASSSDKIFSFSKPLLSSDLILSLITSNILYQDYFLKRLICPHYKKH